MTDTDRTEYLDDVPTEDLQAELDRRARKPAPSPLPWDRTPRRMVAIPWDLIERLQPAVIAAPVVGTKQIVDAVLAILDAADGI